VPNVEVEGHLVEKFSAGHTDTGQMVLCEPVGNRIGSTDYLTRVSGGLTMRPWMHVPSAPNLWAKKSAPHSRIGPDLLLKVLMFNMHEIW